MSEAVKASYGALQANIDEHKTQLREVVERATMKRKVPGGPDGSPPAGSQQIRNIVADPSMKKHRAAGHREGIMMLEG